MHAMLTVLLQNAAEGANQATGAGAPGTTGAPTTTPPAGQDSMLSILILPLTLFAIFYFLVFRPQRKEQKRRMEMLSQVKKGDKVLTHAGIIGTLVNMKDDEVTVEVDDNVRIRFSRAAIAQVLNAETKEKALAAK